MTFHPSSRTLRKKAIARKGNRECQCVKFGIVDCLVCNPPASVGSPMAVHKVVNANDFPF